MKKRIILVLLLGVLLSFTACESKSDLKFGGGEKWSLKSNMDFDAGIAKDVGSIASSVLSPLTGTDLPSGLFNLEMYINPLMSIMKNSLRSEGVDFDWKYDKKTLSRTMSGDSFTPLINGGLLQPIGDNQYRFYIEGEDVFATYFPEYAEEIGQMGDMLSNFSGNEVTFYAGKIIQSNANKQSTRKAVWYNPEVIDVVFVPGSSFGNLFWVLLVAIIVIVLVVVIVKSVGSGGAFCPNCGAKIRRKAKICPQCGSYLDTDDYNYSDSQYDDNSY